jgi:type I restriction enzyme R subunit
LVERYNERKDFQALQSDILDDVAEHFADLFAELVKERNSFTDLGIDFEEKAFYDIRKVISEKYEFEYQHDKLIKLLQEVKAIFADKAKYTDWSSRDDIKAELKVDLILTLAENDLFYKGPRRKNQDFNLII